MAFFACMLILVLLTAPLTLLFRGRRFEELLPASLFGAILVLYLFAMFHQLRAGATAVLALAIAGFLFFLFRVFFAKDKSKGKDALRRFLSPGLAAYAIMGIGAFLLTSGLTALVDNDCFDHWALVVKNMVLLNALGNASGSTVVFQSYPPGVSLLQSWLMLLNGAYKQGLNYAGVALFSITILTPVLRSLEWKRPLHAVGITLLLFLYPIIIFNGNYATLMVDSLIGMLGALMLFTYFENRKDDPYVWFMLAGIGTTLSLVKAFGTVLLAITGAIILADFLINQRKDLVRLLGTKKVATGAILTILGALFGVVSWAVYMAVTPVYTLAQTTGGAMAGLRELLASPAVFFSGYRKDVLFLFVNELLSSVGYRFIQFAYVGWMLLLLVPWLLLILKGKQELRRSRAVLALGLLIGFFVYAGLLLASYLFTFEPARAAMLGSFQRYIFTYFQLALGAVFFLFLNWNALKQKGVHLLLALCLILPFVPVRDMTSMAVQGGSLVESEKPLTHTEQLYQTLDKETTLVGYISADQAYSYWGTRYYATPVPFRYYDLDALKAKMKNADESETVQALLSDLADMGCTHLYVQNSSAAIRAMLAAVDPALASSGDYSLFSIGGNKGAYTLTPCAYIDPNA